MAGKTAILAVRIVTDAKQGVKGVDEYDTALGRLGGTMGKMAVPAAVALGAIAAVGAASVKAASELQQATGAVESVFGAYADTVKGFADDAADNVGLAASQYSQLAAVLGAQLKNLGTPMEAVAGQTDELIRLGADLAATFGGTTADAVAALSSLLRGERDPIERYGVSIKQATIDAKKAELGLAGLTGEADANANATATLALLYQQTADAAGQFGRETDTLAGQQQIATANFEDAKAALGEALLPTMTTLASVAADVARVISENSDAFTILIGVVGAIAAAILVVNGALQAFSAVQAIATAAQWAFNVAMSANPIGLVIIAIGLLIAIIVVLVMNWEQVGAVFEDVINSIVDWWNDLVDSFANGFDQIVGWIQDVIGWFQQLFGWQTSTSSAAAMTAPGVTAFSAGAAGAGPAPFAMPVARRAPAAAPNVLTVNVSGAIDPDATARQIRRVMGRFSRKTGTILAGGQQWQ